MGSSWFPPSSFADALYVSPLCRFSAPFSQQRNKQNTANDNCLLLTMPRSSGFTRPILTPQPNKHCCYLLFIDMLSNLACIYYLSKHCQCNYAFKFPLVLATGFEYQSQSFEFYLSRWQKKKRKNNGSLTDHCERVVLVAVSADGTSRVFFSIMAVIIN